MADCMANGKLGIRGIFPFAFARVQLLVVVCGRGMDGDKVFILHWGFDPSRLQSIL